MEFLQNVLGEELFDQVHKKLKAHDEIQLVNLNDGEFLRKEEVEIQLNNFSEMQTHLEAKLKNLAIEKALLLSGARNVKAVKGLLDLNRIKENDGVFIGLDTQIKALQESDGYLFGVEEKLNTHAGNPADARNVLDFDNLSDEALFAARINEIK